MQCWDLVAGKVRSVLTHHKKAVRAIVNHPRQFSFVSGAADHIKKWSLPDGVFQHNFDGHDSIIDALAINEDGVLVSGGDDGTMQFWDYDTGYCFQKTRTKVQPGSLESEAGVFAMAFDRSGCRLITTEADKTIKIYGEDTTASPESNPIAMKEWTDYVRTHKRF